MTIYTVQNHISIPIWFKKVNADTKHCYIGVNLISPTVGICVDGHHSYMASVFTHKPLTVVILPLDFSGNKSSAALLDHWDALTDRLEPTKEKWSNFYELFSGKWVKPSTLAKVVKEFPDFRYQVDNYKKVSDYTFDGKRWNESPSHKG